MVVVQGLAVDGPDGGHGGGELLLVLGEELEFVHRDRFEVERAGQGVDLSPGSDHQGRVFVVGHRGVFRIGVWVPDAGDRERIGGEERAVDVIVAMADLVDALLGGADAVLQDAVSDFGLAVVAQDAVHLGGVEEVGEEHVGDRHEDESDEDFPDQAVGFEPERGRYDVAREDLCLVREFAGSGPERLGGESVTFLTHCGKNSVGEVQI